MIVPLIRQDPALRALKFWLPSSLATASVLMGLFTLLAAAQRQPVPLYEQLCVIWLGVSLYLLFGGAGTRCSQLDMALPLTTHRLWVAHILAILLMGLLVVAGGMGIVLIYSQVLMGLMGGTSFRELSLWGVILRLLAGLALVTALLETPRPDLREMPASRRQILLKTLILVGGLGLILLLCELPVLFVVVPMVGALILGWRVYCALPPAFSLVPREAQDGDRPQRAADERSATDLRASEAWSLLTRRGRGRGFSFLWLLLKATALSNPRKQLAPVLVLLLFGFLVVMMAGFGFVLSGGWIREEGVQSILMLLTGYLIFTLAAPLLTQLHLFDTLPVSRKTLLAGVLLLSTIPLFIGYGVGSYRVQAERRQSELIQYRAAKSHHYLYIPLSFCSIAWDGEPPDSTSPAGETHTAWRSSLFKGSRAAVYSPYHTPPGSSLDFVAWQISRAADAIYDANLSTEEIKERYLKADNDGRVVLKSDRLSLRKDYPGLVPKEEGTLFPLIFLILGVVLFPTLSVYLVTFRGGIGNGARLFIMFGLMGLLLLVQVALSGAAMARLVDLNALEGFIRILTRTLAQELPGGYLTVYTVCVLLVGFGYWMVQKQFDRVEIPFIGWPRE